MASSTTNIIRHEILQVADAVAREKNIDREIVVEAIEVAIQKAARAKYGIEHDIRVHIDRQSGEIALERFREVVEEIGNEATEILLKDAQKIRKDIKAGEFITDPLPPIDFGRVAAQSAKQVIVQKVKDAERERQYEEYKDRKGEIINGVIKRAEFGNVLVDLGRAEAYLKRDEMIPRENLRSGDRVRALILDVRQETHGPQIFLSRTHPDFMARLFSQEVPEIYEGVIQIKSVARDPGSRAKISVTTNDSSLDPVGACVGMKGSRVQAVVNELGGEKIDIVLWSENPATFIVNALAPAEVSKVIIDEDNGKVEVIVPDDQLSLAIGRRGQNVRLASTLCGWKVNIMTESEEIEKRNKEVQELSKLFIEALDVDEVIAQLLVTEGFTSVHDVSAVELSEIAQIEGFDEELATELQQRATTFLQEKEAASKKKLDELVKDKDLLAIEGFTTDMFITMAEKGVKTRDDLADLSGDELVEILGTDTMDQDAANDIIMKARSHWFEEK